MSKDESKDILRPDTIVRKFYNGLMALLRPSSKRNIYEVRVRTRDCKGAGTDCNIYVVIISGNGDRSPPLLLDNLLKDDMEKGVEDVFRFSWMDHLHNITNIELWRDTTDEDRWFCEYISITHVDCNSSSPCDAQGNTFPFPCHQWIKPPQKYELFVYNFCLPQLDTLTTRKMIRKEEIIDAKHVYRYETKRTGLPRRIAEFPDNERFSSDYQSDITGRKMKLFAQKKLQQWFGDDKWDSFDDMLKVYKRSFTVPKGWYNWKSDVKFGWQRLNGLNNTQLRRCDEIPKRFPVTNEMVAAHLDGHTLEEVIQLKRLFIVDYTWLDGVPTIDSSHQLPAPFGLFYANMKGELSPIAIQLLAEPAEDNPIFLPSDPEYTWMMAKMYFNMADASVHQSCSHLGFTHLVVESIYVAIRQSLPTCHPVYQLFAPHFIYLLGINTVGLNRLLDPGGWFDTAMTIGSKGFIDICQRRWKSWRFDVEGWFPTDIESRGVDDKEVLTSYHSRDDFLLLHKCIMDYVTDVLSSVYDTTDKLLEDYELQDFASILVEKEDGAGFEGVFGDGKFENLDDLIKVVSATIFMSSVVHAAVNFCQYDEYAFPPNYPAKIDGDIPKDKRARTKQDIISALPNKEGTLDTMIMTAILSAKSTDSLGYFDIQYLYEPKAVEAVKRFQENLAKVGQQIEERNKSLELPYTCLHPNEIPNAISI